MVNDDPEKWTPDENTKPVVWFDLVEGTWIVDVGPIRDAVRKGLRRPGLDTAIQTLKNAYAHAKKEVFNERRH